VQRMSLTHAERKDLLQRMFDLLDQHYVFPGVAAKVRAEIAGDFERGAYDSAGSDADFCAAVTERMIALAGDKHLRLRPKAPGRRLMGPGSSPEALEELRRQFAFQNNGFHKVERLAGNVGYLDIRLLVPTEFGGETAVAAMHWLANSSALIIDLRQCPGGSPGMVNLLCSYLFGAQPVHLNSLESRGGETFYQSWTMPWVPGRRLPDVPVWVLTSGSTFSGGEELTYNLKTRKRAIIVGETTGGGANPGGVHSLTEELEVFVPQGRAVNPVTGDNWEGKGVAPDVAVPAAEAFNHAYAAALRQVIERSGALPGESAVLLVKEAEAALAQIQV
jgi:retinol-binding protein 3